MCLVVDGSQALVIDRSVAGRRREAGMAEQLLNGAEIAAAGEEMRRKAVAQRMRGGSLRQSQLGTQPCQRSLNATRHKRRAVPADEERPVEFEAERTGRQVIPHCIGYHRQHRHVAFLIALAADPAAAGVVVLGVLIAALAITGSP
jgi:hypothetical protein